MNIRNILFFLLSLLISQASSVQANIIDSCVAVVNDDVITLSEVNEAGKPMFQRVAEQVPPEQLADALKQARQTVIEKLIETGFTLPGILFMSGYSDNVVSNEKWEERKIEFIQKPFTPIELINRIKTLL